VGDNDVSGGLVAVECASRRAIRWAVRLLSKFGFAIVADLTPSRRVHSLRLPCSWIDVARPQCCFEDVFLTLALTTPGPTTRLFQLSKEESLGDIHLPYASRGRTNETEML